MAKAKKPMPGALPTLPPGAPVHSEHLLDDVRRLIDEARQQVARAVNAGLVTLYWHVGKRIREELLGEGRAEYGKQIVSSLSRQLTEEYGRGFNRRSLFRMIRFAEVFPDERIVSALRTQLSWTHFRELIAIDDPLKREFYAEMCRAERWSTRTLQDQVRRMVYERTAVSKQPEEVIRTAMQLEAAGIRVAEYLTELPPRELLERKLHDAARLAREELARPAPMEEAELPTVPQIAKKRRS